jgi:FlaA1/EpsC-like NDP-sugar epimerase
MPLITSYFSLPRVIQIAIDLTISAFAFGLAYFLRFDGQVPETYMVQLVTLLPVVLGLRMFFRTFGGLHHQLWRYVGLRDAMVVMGVVTCGTFAIYLVTSLALGSRIPWGVVAHDWWLNLVGYICIRVARRLYVERQPSRKMAHAPTRVLLVGAGQAGNMIAREILQTNMHVEVVGFVDDDRVKFRSRVQGIEVLGQTRDIPQLVNQFAVDELIICIPSANEREMRRILDLCRDTKTKIKTKTRTKTKD